MIKEPRSEFIGRHDELSALDGLLTRSRLVTITGVGGVGKTRLAIRAVNARTARSGARCWFVDLGRLHDGRGLPLALARALRRVEMSTREPLDFLRDEVGDDPAIIVLDNCEHLVDDVAAFVDDLLEAIPALTIVATSRRRLEIDGEQVFPAPPLDVEATDGSVAEAVELLLVRARSADASFAFRDDERETAAQLCRALDGLPLAIELAAARLRTLSVADLMARLSARFTILGGSSRSAVARQRTLRAVVDWSYELCTPAQRTLWAQLSVFAGSFAIEDVVAVTGDQDGEVVDALDELVAQSVVEADPASGRFRLLETIRGYGRERADDAGTRLRSELRHLDHYRRRAAAADAQWYGPAQAQILAEQAADRAESQAALETATAVGADAALALFTHLRYHWGVGGFLPEGRRWAARVLALPGPSAQSRASALLAAAWFCLLQGDLAEADQYLNEVDGRSEALSSGPAIVVEIELHRLKGTHALFAGDPAAAHAEFRRSIALATGACLPHEALMAQFQLTVAASHLGLPAAAESAREAARCAESIGERWVRALAQWSIGLAAFADGELDEAERQANAALAVEDSIDDPVAECLVLELLSWIDAARSPSERSAVLLGAARRRWRRIGSDISVHGPQMAEYHDRCAAVVRARLGERSYARLTAIGERLGPVEAASYVPARPPAAELSDREAEVAAGIHSGLSNREIADRLVLSVRTVDTHVQHILAKLGFGSRARIAAWYEARYGETSAENR
ncbi:ATP-binding protein [Microbacterium karelineae]|uniref:ATP-binding protein n=1 Tax=Microbacterium karelineae TaxID=2654283 RepID=UPI0012E99AF2|nr:LuxR C-terminal-related transcriptional regulator [Microbacterium karelineae]